MATSSTHWFWLAFADGRKPVGSQHLGAVVIQAESVIDAILAANAAKLSPPGQVLGVEIGDDAIGHVPESYRNRLLTPDEVNDLDTIFLARQDCQGTA